MSKPRILVTSAAGKTGLPTAIFLRELGFPVTAFVRRDDQRADELRAAGADVFVGNQYSITDMRKAMAGAKRAYQCAPTAPNGLHFNAVFTAAAAEAKIEHVVTLGQWLTSADHPSLFTREVYISDVLIDHLPGSTVTHVNPGWFADNYLMVLDMAASLGMLPMPLGDGDAKTNAPPSNEDIARVAAAALAFPEKHAGKSYRPTGPELMSPNEIAAAMGKALGRKVAYNNVPPKMMLKALKANPPSNYSEAALTQLYLYADEYRRGTFAINAPTDDVEQVGGAKPERFEDIAARYVAFRRATDPGFGKLGRGLWAFIKLLLMPTPNLAKIEAAKDFVSIADPVFSQGDSEWHASHMPTQTLKLEKEAA